MLSRRGGLGFWRPRLAGHEAAYSKRLAAGVNLAMFSGYRGGGAVSTKLCVAVKAWP